jgi:hypothetical protein
MDSMNWKGNLDSAEYKCAKNVVWAINASMGNNKWMYENYSVGGHALTKQTAEKSVDGTNGHAWYIFQCVLWNKGLRENQTDGHGCLKPCEPAPVNYAGTVLCGVPKEAPAPKDYPAGTSQPSTWSGLPGWAWALATGLVVVACLIGLVYAFSSGKKPEKKKKRAVKSAPLAEIAAPLQTAVATTAVPMPVYTTLQTAPVTTAVAPPVYIQAAPVQSITYAAPMPYAAPVTYAAPAVVTAFDTR